MQWLQDYLTQRHERLLQESKLYGEYLKKAADRTLRFIDDLGKRINLGRVSNATYQLEYRYSTHVWLFVAIRAIMETSSTAPLVFRNADKEKIESPLPMFPNQMNTWKQIEEMLTVHLELCGNAYLYHDRANNEFCVLRPSRMKVVPAEDGRSVMGYMYYRAGVPEASNRVGPGIYTAPTALNVNQAGERKSWMYDNPELENMSEEKFKSALTKIKDYVEKGITTPARMKGQKNWIPFDAEEILHFKEVNPTNDFYGLSPLTPLLLSLETDLYARNWNRKFFENGAVPPGVLILPTEMSREDFLKRKREFHKEYGGPENYGKIMVLQGGEEGGAKYTPFPAQHKDFEFIEGLNVTRDEILSIYRVPHVIVAAQLTASHSSSISPGIKEMVRMFWQDTIKPKHTDKASIWNRHFGYDAKTGEHFAYDYEDIEALAPDYYQLGRAAYECLRAGMSVKEVRVKIYGLPPESDGDLYIPSNLRRVED